MKGFWHYEFGGLIFGGAYTWRGLFVEYYGTLPLLQYELYSTRSYILPILLVGPNNIVCEK